MTPTGVPQPDELVQVSTHSAIATGALIRVQRVRASSPDDHVYIDGYILDPRTGNAVESRTLIFLALFHLRVVPEQEPVRRRPVNAGPAVPRQRTAQRPAVRPR